MAHGAPFMLYREPAPMPAPEPLSEAEVLRRAGARQWLVGNEYEGMFCRRCGTNEVERGRICAGRRRWWCWFLWECPIRVEHFHPRCRECEARWLLAPLDVSLEVGIVNVRGQL